MRIEAAQRMAKHRTELNIYRDNLDVQAMKLVKLEVEQQTRDNVNESKLFELQRKLDKKEENAKKRT